MRALSRNIKNSLCIDYFKFFLNTYQYRCVPVYTPTKCLLASLRGTNFIKIIFFSSISRVLYLRIVLIHSPPNTCEGRHNSYVYYPLRIFFSIFNLMPIFFFWYICFSKKMIFLYYCIYIYILLNILQVFNICRVSFDFIYGMFYCTKVLDFHLAESVNYILLSL